MSLPRFAKIILIGSLGVAAILGVISLFRSSGQETIEANPNSVQEVMIPKEKEQSIIEVKEVKEIAKEPVKEEKNDTLPEADIVNRLFLTNSSKLPIVETVTYSSRAPWLKGRPAWIADYAAHYETTRHFIARSLNRKTDYFTQKVSPGDKFNVLKKDIQFHFLIDLSRCKMWFYALDKSTNERFLLKTYKVGLGRKDSSKKSGCLTPVGKFTLGSKVAIYKPGTVGFFQDRKIEMIRVFGTRWIPFSEEISQCSDAAKGHGIHGAPWAVDSKTHLLVEDREKIGKYESDGCIRLLSEDMEEIFAIVISKPTMIELVKDFHDAKLPGIERSIE